MRLFRLIPIVLIAALAACVPAQEAATPTVGAETCTVPRDLPAGRPYTPPAEDIVSDVATAYHLLAVAWSPEQCRTGRDYPDADHQCRDNRFGLILHGLWPNGAPGTPYPRYCTPALAAVPVPAATVREHFCMTPSPTLQQHEWAAHGTCGWADPEAYFADAALLWDRLVRPDLEAIPAERLTVGAIRDAFVAANPGRSRDGVTVVLTDDGWFREARLCYSTAFQPIACPRRSGPSDDTLVKLAARGATAR